MFLFKKMVSRVLFPVPLCLELLWVGLAFWWVKPNRVIGQWLVTSGAALLTLFSFHPFSYLLLEPVETRYPPFRINSPAEGQALVESEHVRWVVVLAGGASVQPDFPLTSQLSKSTVVRMVEGISLYKKLPGVKLLVSGNEEESGLMAQFALAFGVAASHIVEESQSRDTKDQAKYIAAIVQKDKFVLVTEASHMLRSMGLFQKQGLSPIPAPVGHLANPSRNYSLWSLFPNAQSLRMTERAFYEYLGILWAVFRGQI